ncbi:MAG: hypothetical protein RLZZ387_4900 [Chloroflexota bacterium]|jgi:hypothetical protein
MLRWLQEADLEAALAAGGTVTFDCGARVGFWNSFTAWLRP